MKRFLHIAVAMVILVLTSCSDGLPDLGFNFPVREPAPQDGFYKILANEYTNLSVYEQDYRSEAGNADRFAAKARRALRQQDVEPDRPGDHDIPDFARQELEDARAMLLDALRTMRTEQNDSLLAMAQTRYDCWLALREDYPQEDAWISCKDSFYDALGLLTLPKTEGGTFSVYFDEASTVLNAAAMETIQEIAGQYSDRPQWSIVLKGFTDSKGSKSANQVLSMRRAIAVKHALAQQGMTLDSIAIDPEGEAVGDDITDSESRRVDIVVRPHYVANDKKGLKVLQGWQHSGEF